MYVLQKKYVTRYNINKYTQIYSMWRATDVPQNMCHKSRGGENLLVILGKMLSTSGFS